MSARARWQLMNVIWANEGGESQWFHVHQQWSLSSNQRNQRQWRTGHGNLATSWAPLMALPTWPFLFQQDSFASIAGYTSMMTHHSQATRVCRMPLWLHDQMSLAHKSSSKQRKAQGCNCPRWKHLCQSTQITDTQLHCCPQRKANQAPI